MKNLKHKFTSSCIAYADTGRLTAIISFVSRLSKNERQYLVSIAEMLYEGNELDRYFQTVKIALELTPADVALKFTCVSRERHRQVLRRQIIKCVRASRPLVTVYPWEAEKLAEKIQFA